MKAGALDWEMRIGNGDDVLMIVNGYQYKFHPTQTIPYVFIGEPVSVGFWNAIFQERQQGGVSGPPKLPTDFPVSSLLIDTKRFCEKIVRLTRLPYRLPSKQELSAISILNTVEWSIDSPIDNYTDLDLLAYRTRCFRLALCYDSEIQQH